MDVNAINAINAINAVEVVNILSNIHKELKVRNPHQEVLQYGLQFLWR